MIRHPLRILITAIAFYTLLPFFAGIHFTGSLLEALGLSAALTLVLSGLYLLTDIIESSISFRLARRQAGLAKGLIVLLSYWLITYILAPGMLLKAACALMPSHLTMHGFGSVFGGGLILFFIGYFTGAYHREPVEDCACGTKPGDPKGPRACGAPSGDEKGKPQGK